MLVLILSILLASSLTSCVSPSREGLPPDSPFREPVMLAEDLLPQGIAVGDISAASAVVWVRTDGPSMVWVEWAGPSSPNPVTKVAPVMTRVLRTASVMATAATDYTLSIPLEGLTPATRYRYQVWIERGGSGKGSHPPKLAARGEFSTLPDAATSASVIFAWSADLGGQGQCRQGTVGYPIFDVMRRKDLDFFLFLGDTIYADNACSSPPNEPGADFVAAALAEYRDRHRYQRGAASLRRFLEIVPVYVVWDDHEVRNNFAGPFDERMPDGRQALREYWPIASPSDDPNRLYRSVRYGADLELFILDTRQYRSLNAQQDGPAKTMLGAGQLRWLLEGMSLSTATWKVIASSVPLSVPKGGGKTVPGNDGWDGGSDGTGFERERQVIVDAILQRKLTNVVFLSGDVHWVQANAYDPNQDGDIDFYEFVAGPLSANPGRITPASEGLHPTRLINEEGYHNFGLVRVSQDAFDVTIFDEVGQPHFTHSLKAR